jgi:hypothetical protein
MPYFIMDSMFSREIMNHGRVLYERNNASMA